MHFKEPKRLSLAEITGKDEMAGRGRILIVKPSNGVAYWDLFLDEARRTGATEIEYLGQGDEASVHELYRDGTSMQTLIRIQPGGLPMPQYEGILPFYHEATYELPGDPEPDYDKLDGHNVYGVRINVMPKLWTFPPSGTDGMYVIDEEKALEFADTYGYAPHDTISQVSKRLNAQGMSGVDAVNGSNNFGFYCTAKQQYVPMCFDPGSKWMYRYPETIKPGSRWEKFRMQGAVDLHKNGEAKWMSRELWRNIREEIRDDAERLYAGKKTAYCERIERGGVDIPASIHDMLTRERSAKTPAR